MSSLSARLDRIERNLPQDARGRNGVPCPICNHPDQDSGERDWGRLTVDELLEIRAIYQAVGQRRTLAEQAAGAVRGPKNCPRCGSAPNEEFQDYVRYLTDDELDRALALIERASGEQLPPEAEMEG